VSPTGRPEGEHRNAEREAALASDGESPRDSLRRFVFEHAAIRGAVVSLDGCCREILDCHPYPPALRRALGEILAGAALLAASLKFDGSLAVQLQGDGAVQLLVVECDAQLALRAMAQWRTAAEALPRDASLYDLAGGPEHGRLAITLDPKDGGPIYQGIVSLEATSIARLYEHYLATSAQIPSRMRLATTPERAVGLLLQRMPEAAETTTTAWRDASAAVDAVTAARLLAAATPAALLGAAFPADDLRLFRSQPARFACRCSSERVANALRIIGRAEVESIVAEQGSVSVHCEFCNRRYAFDAIAVGLLFPAAPGGPATATH
jgi:molecular chaperone Hsp33